MKRKYLFWIRAWGNFQMDNYLMAKQTFPSCECYRCITYSFFIVKDLKDMQCLVKSTVFISEVKTIHQPWTWICLPLLPAFLACSCGNSTFNWWSIFCSQFLNAGFYLEGSVVYRCSYFYQHSLLPLLPFYSLFLFYFCHYHKQPLNTSKVKVCNQFLYVIFHFILLPQATVF